MLRRNMRSLAESVDAHIAWVAAVTSLFVQADVVGNCFRRDGYVHLFGVAGGPLEAAMIAAHPGHFAAFGACLWRMCPVGSNVYVPNRDLRLSFFAPSETSWLVFPGWAALFVISYRDNAVDRKHLFFVDEDASIFRNAKATKGTPISEPFVADRSPLGQRVRRNPADDPLE